MMYDFVTALEFLTRLRFSQRKEWTEHDFADSVPYFPLVGLVIGLVLAAVNYLALEVLRLPDYLRCVLIITAEILCTGGLMCDGFMDTVDGVFSARSRERMLEIMKDSHVGANAVLGISILLLLKMGLYQAIAPQALSYVLIAMSITTRFNMVFYIVVYPYARPEGIGLLFKKYVGRYSLPVAMIVTLGLVGYLGNSYLLGAGLTFILANGIALYLKGTLGGLTGDTYGALTECGNVIYLCVLYGGL